MEGLMALEALLKAAKDVFEEIANAVRAERQIASNARKASSFVDFTPAHADHEHTGYVLRTQPIDKTYRLGGIRGDDFALTSHEHPEYLRRDDPSVVKADDNTIAWIEIDNATTLNGLKAEDLALAGHGHQEFAPLINGRHTVAAQTLLGWLPEKLLAPVYHDHDGFTLRGKSTKAYALVSDIPERLFLLPSDFALISHTHPEFEPNPAWLPKQLEIEEGFLNHPNTVMAIVRYNPPDTSFTATLNLSLDQADDEYVSPYIYPMRLNQAIAATFYTYFKSAVSNFFTSPSPQRFYYQAMDYAWMKMLWDIATNILGFMPTPPNVIKTITFYQNHFSYFVQNVTAELPSEIENHDFVINQAGGPMTASEFFAFVDAINLRMVQILDYYRKLHAIPPDEPVDWHPIGLLGSGSSIGAKSLNMTVGGMKSIALVVKKPTGPAINWDIAADETDFTTVITPGPVVVMDDEEVKLVDVPAGEHGYKLFNFVITEDGLFVKYSGKYTKVTDLPFEFPSTLRWRLYPRALFVYANDEWWKVSATGFEPLSAAPVQYDEYFGLKAVVTSDNVLHIYNGNGEEIRTVIDVTAATIKNATTVIFAKNTDIYELQLGRAAHLIARLPETVVSLCFYGDMLTYQTATLSGFFKETSTDYSEQARYSESALPIPSGHITPSSTRLYLTTVPKQTQNYPYIIWNGLKEETSLTLGQGYAEITMNAQPTLNALGITPAGNIKYVADTRTIGYAVLLETESRFYTFNDLFEPQWQRNVPGAFDDVLGFGRGGFIATKNTSTGTSYFHITSTATLSLGQDWDRIVSHTTGIYSVSGTNLYRNLPAQQYVAQFSAQPYVALSDTTIAISTTQILAANRRYVLLPSKLIDLATNTEYTIPTLVEGAAFFETLPVFVGRTAAGDLYLVRPTGSVKLASGVSKLLGVSENGFIFYVSQGRLYRMEVFIKGWSLRQRKKEERIW